VIPKVVTFGVFKINFPFLHSGSLLPGDKVCSQRWRRKRGCCGPNGRLWLPDVYQWHGESSAKSVCVCVCVCVSPFTSNVMWCMSLFCFLLLWNLSRARVPPFFDFVAKCMRWTQKHHVTRPPVRFGCEMNAPDDLNFSLACWRSSSRVRMLFGPTESFQYEPSGCRLMLTFTVPRRNPDNSGTQTPVCVVQMTAMLETFPSASAATLCAVLISDC